MAAAQRKVALIMGVANQRSIAWASVESFYQKNWDVIITYQNERFQKKIQSMIDKATNISTPSQNNINDNSTIVSLPCNIVQDVPQFFSSGNQPLMDALGDRKINSILHSIAHATNLTTPLYQTTSKDFLEAHEISAYSLIDVANHSKDYLLLNDGQDNASNSSAGNITALTYIGAVRAFKGYNVMGPAKASLESIVRGLSLELGLQHKVRVNAVSAGPLPTLSAKGISNFSELRQHVQDHAPLGNITAQQVADTIYFLAGASGITGQTIYVDGGYSTVGEHSHLD